MLSNSIIIEADIKFDRLQTAQIYFAPDGSPEEERESSVALEENLDHLWKVIVWNDPVNLMNYVVMVFKKVFGYSDTKATKHMMEACVAMAPHNTA